ncbi:MAG: UDP-N-acetylmuramyl-tripeptide synthetase [Candidatus Pacebacteria bacterium]|nr:UDP-N-acetylmuramyl-tripeptide synthetase [Candidatus Paceibacterota bacterium]
MRPNSTAEKILNFVKRLIPRNLFKKIQPIYHYFLALLSAIVYRFPSRYIKVIAITGTKGKTSTAEVVNAILEEAGYKTALAGTLRFKVGEQEERNLFKMTMPGRFFVQNFLHRAVKAGCDFAILEMTSEAAKVFRHKFIEFDALLFTNLSPEHIESHGSFENYKKAKLSLAKALTSSPKRPRILIANSDDPHAKDFLAFDADIKKTYSLKDGEPYNLEKNKTVFMFGGAPLEAHLYGIFNLSNILAGIAFAKTLGVSDDAIRHAIQNFKGIRGRVERVNAGQEFDVIVDYAHTVDSLEKVYGVFEGSRKICILGGTGGGRDTRKRPAMGRVASENCEKIILTDEDPYDEDPKKIVSDIMGGIPKGKAEIIMDRRKAIAKGLKYAKKGDAVIITGKGTDPYIMGPNGTKTPWDDADVAREELAKLGFKK